VLHLALASAACDDQPTSVFESFDWEVSIADLDEAVMSVCGSDGVVYAVGGTRGRGMILEYRGGRFSTQSLPESDLLWWCYAAGNVTVAVGESGTILRRGAEKWVRETTPVELEGQTLYGVWADGSGSLYVVGGDPNRPDLQPVAARLQDGIWEMLDTSELIGGVIFKIWGSSPNDIWAVGSKGLIAKVEDNALVRTESPTTADLIAVHGSRANDVYAVGGTGNGVVLRFDGNEWTPFATTPEELSAVWTAPGRPLYIAGDRGFFQRYPRRQNLIVAEATTAVVAPDLCAHALVGVEDFVVAAMSDLVSGNRERWRGGVLSHGRVLGGGIVRPIPVDAGDPGSVSDAGPTTDASDGLGETCGIPPQCPGSLECWYLQLTGKTICTRECTGDADCAGFPGGACCSRPGLQTITTVCIPEDAAECLSPI